MLVITSATMTAASSSSSSSSLSSPIVYVKRNNRLWRLTLSLLIIIYNLEFVMGSVEISNHIRKCCSSGIRHARKNSYCHNNDFEVDAIPPLWRGLCYSTFGVCCSREIQQQHCVAGRLAALTGSRCDEKFNTTSYADCCRFCQVGLAVRASENNCDDAMFAYFANDESYNICCGGNETLEPSSGGEKSRQAKEQALDISERGSKVVEAPTHGDKGAIGADSSENIDGETRESAGMDAEADGAIVLSEGDDDICGKVPNLCAHICENTKEAYVCKCNPGYKLDSNSATCSLIEAGEEDSVATSDKVDEVEEPDEDEDVDDLDSLEEGDDEGSQLCPPGFELKRNKCIDIDECALQRAKCKTNQYCHNTMGSYRCLNIKGSECPEGYRLSTKTDMCEDIDECEEELDDCEANQQCLNLKGSFKCQLKVEVPRLGGSRYQQSSQLHKCGSGFQFKNGRCIDIDECATDENACDSSQVCTNDIGGYHCDCKIGFNLDTTTNACIDINECSINNHNCLSTQRCDNTLGSYVCTRLQSCGTGYTFNAQTNNCDDDDECVLNTHTCTSDYTCHNTMGSFRCHYVRTTSTTTTTTTTTTTKAPTTTTAKTTSTTSPPSSSSVGHPYYAPYRNRTYAYPPSYASHQTYSRNQIRDYSPVYVGPEVSSMPCGNGFHRNHLGACVDTNECQEGNPCGTHQRCINTNGSYRCQNLLQCGTGYKSTPDGTACVDIDECETGEHNCAENQICRNRQGGYICSCPPGHQLTRLSDGQRRCVDINECEQERPTVCPSNAQCMNTLGSFYCECKSGFQKSKDNDRICLDVDECQEIPGLCQQKCVNFWGGYRCTCNAGYELSPDNRTCNDLDECEVHKAYKLCMGFCNNVPGSYECSCPRGYTLAMDKNTCRDIDECATGDVCTGRHDICTNVRGSYKCTTIHCPYGYVNDPDQKNRCRQTSNLCEGDDCYNKPSAYTYNFITLVSKLQIPPEGRTVFSLHGPQWYDDIDFDLKIVKIQAAANIEKASENHFDTIKSKHEVHLSLRRSLEGPQDIELELSMTVFTNGMPRGKSVAKIFIIVSQYTF